MENHSCIYAGYFGLEADPFGLTPDPEFFYLSQSHNTALEWMTYTIEQYEMGLVIGEIGAGKTVLSRCIVDNLPEEKYRVCWIINPQFSAVGLLKEMYRQLFNEKPKYFKRDVLNQLQNGLVELYQRDIFPVVIIDEAQTIPTKAVFEELRLLSNFQTDKQNLLSFLLMGQPELEKRLRRRYYKALMQRIRFTIKLKPLTPEETAAYLHHRMVKVGYKGPALFKPEIAQKIHKLSKGYPRPINHLATLILMQVMGEDSEEITLEMVDEAASEIMYL